MHEGYRLLEIFIWVRQFEEGDGKLFVELEILVVKDLFKMSTRGHDLCNHVDGYKFMKCYFLLDSDEIGEWFFDEGSQVYFGNHHDLEELSYFGKIVVNEWYFLVFDVSFELFPVFFQLLFSVIDDHFYLLHVVVRLPYLSQLFLLLFQKIYVLEQIVSHSYQNCTSWN